MSFNTGSIAIWSYVCHVYSLTTVCVEARQRVHWSVASSDQSQFSGFDQPWLSSWLLVHAQVPTVSCWQKSQRTRSVQYNDWHQLPRWALCMPICWPGVPASPFPAYFPQLLFPTLHRWRQCFSVTCYVIVTDMAYLHSGSQHAGGYFHVRWIGSLTGVSRYDMHNTTAMNGFRLPLPPPMPPR